MNKPGYLSEITRKTTLEIKVIYLELKGNPQDLDEQGVQPLIQTLEEHKITPIGPNMGIFYTNSDEVGMNNVEWDYCIPVLDEIEVKEPVKFKVLPPRKVASIVVHGTYSRIGDGYKLLQEWARKDGIELKWPLVEVYRKEAPDYTEEEYETELQLELP